MASIYKLFNCPGKPMPCAHSHLHNGVNNHGDLHELQTQYFVDEWCNIEADSNVKVGMEIY